MLNIQVIEPLKAMVNGAALEDARHLVQRYGQMRQDVEAQVIRTSQHLHFCISVGEVCVVHNSNLLQKLSSLNLILACKQISRSEVTG